MTKGEKESIKERDLNKRGKNENRRIVNTRKGRTNAYHWNGHELYHTKDKNDDNKI